MREVWRWWLPAVVLLAAACGCSRKEPAKAPDAQDIRAKMGNVPVSIRAFGPDENTCKQALEAGFARVDELNALLSDYVPDSEVSRVNRAAGGGAVAVSAETFEVIRLAKDWHGMTSGAFDPTIRPALKLWKLAARDDELPSDAEIEAARKLIGAGKIEMDAAKRTVRLSAAGMSLDLGGIAKGYIVDRAAEALRERGATAGVIDAGGDVLVLGRKPGGKLWRIAVENPPPRDKAYTIVLGLSSGAVATSGDYRRGLFIEDKTYSHIIDPRTGRPAGHVTSATVIAKDLATADALATALCVLGPEEGIKLIGKLDATEALIFSRRNDTLRAVTSRGFTQYVMEGKQELVELQHGND